MAEKRAYVCGDKALIIFHPTTGSDSPLTPIEEMVVALHAKADDLTRQLATARAVTLAEVAEALDDLAKTRMTDEWTLCTRDCSKHIRSLKPKKCKECGGSKKVLDSFFAGGEVHQITKPCDCTKGDNQGSKNDDT